MGRAVNSSYRRSDSEDDLERTSHVSMDYGIFGDWEYENQETHVLVIRESERRHKMTWTMFIPTKGIESPWITKRAARFIDQLGHNRVTLRKRISD